MENITQARVVLQEYASAIKELQHVSTLSASETRILGHIDCNRLRTLAVSIKGTYHSSATLGMKLQILHSPDGKRENYDTVDYLKDQFVIDFTSGSTVKETNNVDLPEEGQALLQIVNLDTGQAVTEIHGWAFITRWGKDNG